MKTYRRKGEYESNWWDEWDKNLLNVDAKETFKATERKLHKFKVRHGISFQKLYGGSGTAYDEIIYTGWYTSWNSLYKLMNVINIYALRRYI